MHFTDYTLTNGDLYHYGQVFSLILVGIFILAKVFLNHPKKLSWALSMVNSLAMSIASIIYLAIQYPHIRSSIESNQGVHIFHGKTDFVVLISLWFGLANIIDIFFGLIFYRKYLGILTAYIHHSVYVWIMIFGVTGHGGIATSRPFAPAFALATIEEIPTFILALGSIYPSLRTDIGFGLSFFILRIVYHFGLLAYSVYSGCDLPVIIIYSLTAALHVNWFTTWISKYGSSYVKASKSTEKLN